MGAYFRREIERLRKQIIAMVGQKGLRFLPGRLEAPVHPAEIGACRPDVGKRYLEQPRRDCGDAGTELLQRADEPTADMAADARDPLVMDAAQFEQRDAPFHAELNRGLGITGKLVRNDADIHRRLHFE